METSVRYFKRKIRADKNLKDVFYGDKFVGIFVTLFGLIIKNNVCSLALIVIASWYFLMEDLINIENEMKCDPTVVRYSVNKRTPNN